MLYVVEMTNSKGEWIPTLGVELQSVALTQTEAEFTLMPKWQAKFPRDHFRVKKYARIGR